jgi:FAD/FMN-containing dehydrogenase
MSALLDELRAVVGAHNVLADGDLSAWEVDWRKRTRGRALAVVRPATTGETAAVVAACARHGAAIVPQGGNTGLTGASVPDGSGTQVLLSLARLNRVREIDPINLTMTVEAGCVLQAVQEAAAQRGLLFPLSLAAEGSCTIGGNLSTNAGGTQVLRYGNARDLCLGLEVVTPAGEVWHGLAGLRKDNTGYDLRDLYIGSEGTLGIITAATLELYPGPRSVLTAMASCPSLEAAARVLGIARSRAADLLTGCEVMGEFALSLVRRHFPQLTHPLPPAPWTLLIELSGPQDEAHVRAVLESLLSEALEQGHADDAALASSLEQSKAMWHLRESIPLAQAAEGHNVKHDIALPVSRIPAFVASTDAALLRAIPGIRLVNFGHLGDGNLHYNVQGPEGTSADDFLRLHEKPINSIVYDAVIAHGGSISAEHGIGALKREELARRKSPVALALMRAIKQALDPRNLMNPGRVL